jgi:hypothetical protein
MIGAKVEISFDWQEKMVTINQLETELKLPINTFLNFLNLIDICFMEVYPMGSVVELDLEWAGENVKQLYSETEALVTIVARRAKVVEEFDYFIDYVAYLWPFGLGGHTAPLYLSNHVIKRSVFTGMTNETEEQFVEVALRSDMIYGNQKSMSYLNEEEAEELEKYLAPKRPEREGEVNQRV